MSQDIRRRLAARRAWRPRPHTEGDLPAALRIRRFSEGLERAVLDELREPHVGRFSQGAEQLPEDAAGKDRIGRYSDGIAQLPDDPHVGRFSQGADHQTV